MNENIPPVEPAVDPEAEPKNKNRTWIIIGVVVLLLCCCCVAVVALGWTFGDQLMSDMGLYY